MKSLKDFNPKQHNPICISLKITFTNDNQMKEGKEKDNNLFKRKNKEENGFKKHSRSKINRMCHWIQLRMTASFLAWVNG